MTHEQMGTETEKFLKSNVRSKIKKQDFHYT